MVLSIKDGKLNTSGKSIFSSGSTKSGIISVPKTEKFVIYDENSQVVHERTYEKEHIAKKLADGINIKYSTFGAAATAIPASVFKSKHLKNCIGTCNIFNSYKKSNKKSGIKFELNELNDGKNFDFPKK